MPEHILDYLGLFVVSFVSATVFPFQSEIALLGMLLRDHYPWWHLVLVASVGNILGSVVNWVLGRVLTRFEGRRWFPLKRETLTRAERWYKRYGRWSLLLSWMPFGDALTIIAGVFRERLPIFLVLVTFAKLGRYLAVVAAWYGVM